MVRDTDTKRLNPIKNTGNSRNYIMKSYRSQKMERAILTQACPRLPHCEQLPHTHSSLHLTSEKSRSALQRRSETRLSYSVSTLATNKQHRVVDSRWRYMSGTEGISALTVDQTFRWAYYCGPKQPPNFIACSGVRRLRRSAMTSAQMFWTIPVEVSTVTAQTSRNAFGSRAALLNYAHCHA